MDALDSLTLARIAAKGLGDFASLTAAGLPLFLLTFRDAAAAIRSPARAFGLATGLIALALIATRLALEVVFLGGGWDALDNHPLVAMVTDGPAGQAAALRALGLVIVLIALVANRAVIGAAGAGLVALSFAITGHTLAEPRSALALLITAHTLAIAFWLGSLWPLARIAARLEPRAAGAVMAQFGDIAQWVVMGLILAGMALMMVLTGGADGLLGTLYGQWLLAKFAAVTALLALAGYHKLALTPALQAGDAAAAQHLRRSIGVEMLVALAVVMATAALTSLAAPK